MHDDDFREDTPTFARVDRGYERIFVTVMRDDDERSVVRVTHTGDLSCGHTSDIPVSVIMRLIAAYMKESER